MKIFLDFDGVLRRESSPKSRLDALRKLFSPALASRIEGVTPDLTEAEEYARHAEVNAYRNRNKLQGVRWIAVDDDPEGYRPGAPLLQVDPALGFNEECARRLRAWLVQG